MQKWNFQNEAKEMIHHRCKKSNSQNEGEKKRNFRDVKREFSK